MHIHKAFKVLLTSGSAALLWALNDSFGNVSGAIVDAANLLDEMPASGGVLFIDWMLPSMAGVQLLSYLRTRFTPEQAHITMVLPEADEALFARALAAGADDYVVGPLEPGEFVERVKLYLPGQAQRQQPIALGELTVDPVRYVVRWRDRVVPLQGNELRLMLHFARFPNRVIARTTLMQVLGYANEAGQLRRVDLWVSRLRARLADHGVPVAIRTVRGFGYVYDCVEPALSGDEGALPPPDAEAPTQAA